MTKRGKWSAVLQEPPEEADWYLLCGKTREREGVWKLICWPSSWDVEFLKGQAFFSGRKIPSYGMRSHSRCDKAPWGISPCLQTLNLGLPLKKVRNVVKSRRPHTQKVSSGNMVRDPGEKAWSSGREELHVPEGNFHQKWRNVNRHLGVQSTQEKHTGYISWAIESQVSILPALNIRVFILKVTNDKGVFRKRIDQACVKEVSIGFSSMKCFSESLGCRKVSGVKEVNRELRKKGRTSSKHNLQQKKLEEEATDWGSPKIPIELLQYVALLGILMPTNFEKRSWPSWKLWRVTGLFVILYHYCSLVFKRDVGIVAMWKNFALRFLDRYTEVFMKYCDVWSLFQSNIGGRCR